MKAIDNSKPINDKVVSSALAKNDFILNVKWWNKYFKTDISFGTHCTQLSMNESIEIKFQKLKVYNFEVYGWIVTNWEYPLLKWQFLPKIRYHLLVQPMWKWIK